MKTYNECKEALEATTSRAMDIASTKRIDGLRRIGWKPYHDAPYGYDFLRAFADSEDLLEGTATLADLVQLESEIDTIDKKVLRAAVEMSDKEKIATLGKDLDTFRSRLLINARDVGRSPLEQAVRDAEVRAAKTIWWMIGHFIDRTVDTE